MNKKHILIVDDEEAVCDALGEGLKNAGFKTSSALNGKEGLEKALKEHPDLILLDILMPEINGWEMLEELKKDSWGKNAKVIILTNLSDMENVSKALEHGTYDYLVKTNWKIEEVVGKIKRKLNI